MGEILWHLQRNKETLHRTQIALGMDTVDRSMVEVTMLLIGVGQGREVEVLIVDEVLGVDEVVATLFNTTPQRNDDQIFECHDHKFKRKPILL